MCIYTSLFTLKKGPISKGPLQFIKKPVKGVLYREIYFFHNLNFKYVHIHT